MGTVHGISMLAAAVTVLFGLAAGLMYLWQAKRLKQKRPSSVAVRLPSLEWLQIANARALVISMLLTGLAAGSGIVLNWLGARQGGQSVPWYVMLGTLAMFAWLLLHVIRRRDLPAEPCVVAK